MTTDIDPELAEAVAPHADEPKPEEDDVPEEPTSTPANAQRQQSTMGIAGIESVLEAAMDDRDMDQDTKDLISGCIKDIDRNIDGRVDRYELVNFAINLTGQVKKLKKKNFSLKIWFQIAVVACLFLVLSTFASSAAAVFLAKDTHIDDGALVTRNNQAVSTTTNELEATVGALAFLPDEARKHVKSITFRGDGSDGEEVVYEKLVGSIVVHPKKSVILTTTEGDSLKWSLADNKTLVKITLANGDSWMLDSGCEKCTILNLKENDEIVDALDEYHVTIGTVLHERGRVLHNICGTQTHTHTTAYSTCSLPHSFKPYFQSAKGEIESRVQAQVTNLLASKGYDVPLKKLLDHLGTSSTLPNYTDIFNMKEDLFDKMFDGVDSMINTASDQAVDIGGKIYSNMQTFFSSGTFSLNVVCTTSNTTWTMDLKVTGTLPSLVEKLVETLDYTGIGTQLPILPYPLPPIDIKRLPSVRVDFELDTPLSIDIAAKQVTMLSSYAKILTRLEAEMSQCVDLSLFSSLSGNVNLRGGFVTEALFDFRLAPVTGIATIVNDAPSFTYQSLGNNTVTASGGYSAAYDMPMPKDNGGSNPATFVRNIAFRATDNDMFDAEVMPCVSYDLSGGPGENQCADYECSRYSSYYGSVYCLYDLCDWVGAAFLPTAFETLGMSSTCAASSLVAPNAPAANQCS